MRAHKAAAYCADISLHPNYTIVDFTVNTMSKEGEEKGTSV